MDSVDASDQLGRLVERVAALEGRTTEAISSLKDDTKSIRTTLHDSNNTLTTFIAQHMSVVEQFKIHVAGCDQRGKRMERAIWLGVVTTLAVLGYLLEPHFRMLRASELQPPKISAPAVIVQPAEPVHSKAKGGIR